MKRQIIRLLETLVTFTQVVLFFALVLILSIFFK